MKVRELEARELDRAVEIVVRAMSDNPLHVRAFGTDPVRCARAVERLQAPIMKSVMTRGGFLCVEHEGDSVGVLGTAKRKLTIAEAIGLLPAILVGLSPSMMVRMGRWLSQWARRQPNEPFWHLGPVAVEPGFQGRGIGSAIMEAVCARLDEQGAMAYLETDKLINVHFYRKFGFETIGQGDTIGVPNWFMKRKPKIGRNAS